MISVKDPCARRPDNNREMTGWTAEGELMSVSGETRERESSGLTPARAEEVVELVEIAPQAIVSRVLARTSGGSVTLFAIDQGQRLSEHTAPFDAVVYLVEGCLELVIGGEAVELQAGQMLLMPAHVPHGLRAVKASRMMLTMLRHNGVGSN